MKTTYCQKPDIDCPKIKCGRPLPCLLHLDVIIRENGAVRFITSIHGEKRRRVIKVAKALAANRRAAQHPSGEAK